MLHSVALTFFSSIIDLQWNWRSPTDTAIALSRAKSFHLQTIYDLLTLDLFMILAVTFPRSGLRILRAFVRNHAGCDWRFFAVDGVLGSGGFVHHGVCCCLALTLGIDGSLFRLLSR